MVIANVIWENSAGAAFVFSRIFLQSNGLGWICRYVGVSFGSVRNLTGFLDMHESHSHINKLGRRQQNRFDGILNYNLATSDSDVHRITPFAIDRNIWRTVFFNLLESGIRFCSST